MRWTGRPREQSRAELAKTRNRLSRVLLTGILSLASWSYEAGAKDMYTVQGRQVTKAVYEAGLLVNEGTSLLHDNRNDEALSKLQQAVSMAPNMAEAHHNLGLALAKLGKTDEACEQFKTAIAQNPGIDSTWLSLGGLYQSSGKIKEAIEEYTEFLTRFPHHRDASKVVSLVQGLQREQSMANSRSKSSFVATRSDDYLAEVTRQGIIKWPRERMPLKVMIESGISVPGYRSEYLIQLTGAFKDWALASGKTVAFEFVNNPALCDIECSWESDPKRLWNNAEAGETRLTRDKFGICKGTIRLLTMPTLPEMPMTENCMRTICLHEVGHVLGLAGHTNNPSDAMFFSGSIADQYRSLTQRDANTLYRLYTETAQIKHE